MDFIFLMTAYMYTGVLSPRATVVYNYIYIYKIFFQVFRLFWCSVKHAHLAGKVRENETEKDRERKIGRKRESEEEKEIEDEEKYREKEKEEEEK